MSYTFRHTFGWPTRCRYLRRLPRRPSRIGSDGTGRTRAATGCPSVRSSWIDFAHPAFAERCHYAVASRQHTGARNRSVVAAARLVRTGRIGSGRWPRHAEPSYHIRDRSAAIQRGGRCAAVLSSTSMQTRLFQRAVRRPPRAWPHAGQQRTGNAEPTRRVRERALATGGRRQWRRRRRDAPAAAPTSFSWAPRS